jgi:hypothetical protein
MSGQTAEVIVMRRPVERASTEAVICEGTTGRSVKVRPQLAVVWRRPTELKRVWAVAEPVATPAGSPRQPELAFYRKYTESMLRRYLRMSMSAGRVPSVMDRALFQGMVTHRRSRSFEDVVVFCVDMERQLGKLRPMEQRLVTRIAMQRYTQSETAALLGLGLRTVVRGYGQALDSLTELLLAAGMLEPFSGCQGREG